MQYIKLLESIAFDEIAEMRKQCEGNLYKAFSEGLDELKSQTQDIRVLKPYEGLLTIDKPWLVDEHFEMEVIDVDNVLGVSLDRETNNRTTFNPIPNQQRPLRFFIPNNLQWGDKLNMTMRLRIKVTTPIKLNLVNNDGQLMIREDDEFARNSKEVHFI